MSLKKVLPILLLSVSVMFATQFKPKRVFTVHGNINDIVYKNAKVYAGTAAGKVDIVDIKNGKILKEISLSPIKDFMGDTIDSEVFSVDVEDNKILILSQDFDGYARLDLYKNGKLEHIFDKKDKMFIVKAKFISSEKILFALLSNVYALYDLKSKKILWQEQISMSKFSNFALNDEKSEVATADESGDVSIVSLKDGKVIRHYKGINKDEVFGIDWKKSTIITGGKDKKVGIYDANSYNASEKSYGFFIYSVALSSDAKIAAASINDKNDVVLFDVASKDDRDKLVQNSSKIVSIIFINGDKEVVVAANNNKINLYKIKE